MTSSLFSFFVLPQKDCGLNPNARELFILGTFISEQEASYDKLAVQWIHVLRPCWLRQGPLKVPSVVWN